FRSDVEGSARDLAAGFLGPPMWMVGSNLVEVMTTGTVNPAAPGGLYEYYGKHPEEAMWFGRAMSRVTSAMVGELAASGFRPLASGRPRDVARPRHGPHHAHHAGRAGAHPRPARGVDGARGLPPRPGHAAGPSTALAHPGIPARVTPTPPPWEDGALKG